MGNWVCSKCGRDDAVALASRPSLDERYAVGYCKSCTPLPTPDPNRPGQTKPVERATVPLVSSEKWDPELLRRRQEQAAEQKLVRDLHTGKLRSSADRERALGVIRRWEAEAKARRTA